MIIELLSVVILLTAEPVAPEYAVEAGSTHGVLVSAEANPEMIEISAILPSGDIVQVVRCQSSSTCSSNVTFAACGLFQLLGVIHYQHGDESGQGPYVFGVNAVVIVTGCEVFEDGFEDGTTDAWSAAQGGTDGTVQSRSGTDREFDQRGRIRLAA